MNIDLRPLCEEGKFSEVIKLIGENITPAHLEQRLGLFQAFIDIEREYHLSDYPDLRNDLRFLLEKNIKDVITPVSLKGSFQVQFLAIIPLLKHFPENNFSSAELIHLKQQLMQQIPSNEGHRFMKICFLYYINAILLGVDPSSKIFIQELFTIRPDKIFAQQNDFAQFCHLYFKPIFSSIHQLISIYENDVLNDDFQKLDLMTQKIKIIWMISYMWNIYGAEKEFLNLYEPWLQVFKQALQNKNLELALFMHWPLSHCFLNLSQTQEQFQKFNTDVDQPLATYLLQNPEGKEIHCLTKKKESSVLKVGILYDRIVMNSPFKVLSSITKALHQSKDHEINITLYDIEHIEKSASDKKCIEMLLKNGIEYVSAHHLIEDQAEFVFYDHHRKCQHLREKIISDEIDVLIVTGNREHSVYLTALRSAPVQIYWSHGNNGYKIPHIDAYIVHSKLDNKITSLEGINYHHFVGGMDVQYYNPPIDPLEIQQERQKYPSDKIILGTISRLIKVDSEDYIKSIAAILNENPNALFLACGAGGSDNIKVLLKKYQIEERFLLVGAVNPHVYGHIIDLFLDTFPLENGESITEYMSKSKPTLSVSPSGIKVSEDNPSIYPQEYFEKYLSQNPETKAYLLANLLCRHHSNLGQDYLDCANFLIQTQAARKHLGIFLGNMVKEDYLNLERCAKSFTTVIKKIYNECSNPQS